MRSAASVHRGVQALRGQCPPACHCTQVCKDLAAAAVPGLVAAGGLLEGGRGTWVLSVEEGLQEKLEMVCTVSMLLSGLHT
jgi:hypothetical protein